MSATQKLYPKWASAYWTEVPESNWAGGVRGCQFFLGRELIMRGWIEKHHHPQKGRILLSEKSGGRRQNSEQKAEATMGQGK